MDIEKTAEHVSEAVTNHKNRSVDWEKKRLELEEMKLELQDLVECNVQKNRMIQR